MNILAIESSAVAAGAAILKDGQLISESFLNVGLTHSQTLLPLIENTLHAAKLTTDDIDIIAVAAGPGSFTGIRIGVAAAKGLAFTKNTPCYGISTLEGMAWSAATENMLLCPVMDARCMQVYTALFESRNDVIERLHADSAVRIDALRELLIQHNKSVLLFGDGAEKFAPVLKEAGIDIHLAGTAIRMQHANGIALAAMHRYTNAIPPIAPEQLVPDYLRLSQAERERQNKLKGETKQ